MGGLVDIINNFQVDKIVLPSVNEKKITAKWYNKLMTTLRKGKYEVEVAEKGKTYNIDDVEIKIISDGLYQGSNINNYSTVLKISYG